MEVYIINLILMILIAMFVLGAYFLSKKDNCMYQTRNSIEKRIFPIIKIKLIEMIEYIDKDIEKMCLDTINANIIKTKYTNNLSYNILIKDMECCKNTKILSVHIFNKKNELFSTVNEKKYFTITSRNGNYYIDEIDDIDLN